MKKITPKKTYSKKVISYTMQPDVVEAIEKIMKDEGRKTIHSAINACVLQRNSIRISLSNREDECIILGNENRELKDLIGSYAMVMEKLMQYTKMT